MIQKVQNIPTNQKIAATLLIHVKGTFDHVFRAKLAKKMANLSIDNDLIEWTQSLLTVGYVKLLIDRFINPECKVETGIS